MTEPVPTAGIWASLGFLSWAVYGFFSDLNSWMAAAVTGLLITAFVLSHQYRRGAVKLMDLTAAAYFAAATITIAIGDRELLAHYNLPLAWGVFAIVAWLTIFMDRPFTEQYARESAPRELWRAPLFHRMNLEVTLVWALIFTFGAVTGILSLYIGRALLLGLILPMSAMAAGFVFNRYYPRRYLPRLAALGDAAEVDEAPRRAHNLAL